MNRRSWPRHSAIILLPLVAIAAVASANGGYFATAFGWMVIGLSDGFGSILLATILASAAYAPVLPLTDTYALKGLGARRRAYGPVRLWGSAAFIAGNLGAGLLVDVIAPRDLVWLIVAAFCAAGGLSDTIASPSRATVIAYECAQLYSSSAS